MGMADSCTRGGKIVQKCKGENVLTDSPRNRLPLASTCKVAKSVMNEGGDVESTLQKENDSR